ncbi:c6 zinc finger domain containing protein [Grosmannia clavigera kw1407]|uniref:C6 zinc finger domain containing protein n=1 Tax=Grosmannia clavigera (strain kw1407 / UAMH 11150) TaxID=655863 RepID=F0XJW7_GROCL|nr:c6 zinc finger domain containing protein [Grosmannia clavigera kw1407]EFX02022.1 c6 zinc finger domain containing protein [Grosmannia clavigera kw1407]
MSTDFSYLLGPTNSEAMRGTTEDGALLPGDSQSPGSLLSHTQSRSIDSHYDNLGGNSLAMPSMHPNSLYSPSKTQTRLPLSLPLQQFPDCLTRLPSTDPVHRYGTRLMVQVLRSYPAMMLRRETFPPFIHARNGRGTQTLPAPLANCMGIAQLFAGRSPETRSFLWHSIRCESQHAMNNAYSMSKEDLLASVQVQMIFLIMRVVDEAIDPPELNYELLWIFKLLCTRFAEVGMPDGEATIAANTEWEEWVQTESKIRTALTFFVISQIVSVYTGIKCGHMDEFQSIPLCSAKTLWEARTDVDWASERALTLQRGDGLQTIGDLMQLQSMCGGSQQERALDSWNASADGLGHLLGIAASMVSCAEKKSIGTF